MKYSTLTNVKLYALLMTSVVLLIALVVATSCEDSPIDNGPHLKLKSATNSLTRYIPPDTVNLNKVELFLSKGVAASGTVKVEIRSMQNSLKATATFLTDTMHTGSSWVTFRFQQPTLLHRGEKYRIFLSRSDAHNAGSGNYIFWRSSSANVNAYPNGSNDLYPALVADYAFRTHVNGGVDQQQTTLGGMWAVTNTQPRWQEFIADYPKTNLTSVQLFLTVGSSFPAGDTLTVIVHGLGSSYADSVKYQIRVPSASLTPGSRWYSFNVRGALYRDQQFTITLRRNGIQDWQSGQFVYWHGSNGPQDAYPAGYSDQAFYSPSDYAFRTYTPHGLDQQQSVASDTSISVWRGHVRWQTFVPVRQ